MRDGDRAGNTASHRPGDSIRRSPDGMSVRGQDPPGIHPRGVQRYGTLPANREQWPAVPVAAANAAKQCATLPVLVDDPPQSDYARCKRTSHGRVPRGKRD
uniref:(northern house mosquito) hypothetical protein n=1 Tax=Culex pipiens TaxID=7175 RepID=A0A8D8KP31_CULPI